MRDSLVKLSLALKDLQFETDLELRKNAEIAVHQMIQHMTTPRGAPPPS